MNLPWDDRTVEVFTYLSVFTAEQKLTAREVMDVDKYMSTDEVIYDIATKKQKLADGLFEIAQSAAVDCQLHYHEHGEKIKCYVTSSSSGENFTSHPNWQKDLRSDTMRAVDSSRPGGVSSVRAAAPGPGTGVAPGGVYSVRPGTGVAPGPGGVSSVKALPRTVT